MKLSDLKLNSRSFSLFVGESGSGKTCAALSWPRPILVIDLDERIRGGLAAKKWLENFDDITVEKFNTYTDIDIYLEKLVSQYNVTKKFPYKTIVFDSLTSGSRVYVQEGIKLTLSGDTSDDGARPRRYGRVYLPGFNAYNYESNAHYNVLLAYLKNFPCHVIVSGHMAQKYDKKGEPAGIELLGRPKIAAELPAYFDEVYEFEKKFNEFKNETKYFVRLKGDLAKTAYINAPVTPIDITGKSFYAELQKIQETESVEEKEKAS